MNRRSPPQLVSGKGVRSKRDVALLDLLSHAAMRAPESGGGYVVVNTATVILSCIHRSPALWTRAASMARMSLEGYEANLRWAAAHSSENVGEGDSPIDQLLTGVRLTTELAGAVDRASSVAADIAGTEEPAAHRLVPVVVLSYAATDAATGLTDTTRTRLRDGILALGFGARIPDLDARLARPLSESTATTAERTPSETKPTAVSRAGFNAGTLIGAFVLSLIGGMTIGGAVLVSFVVRWAASRASKRGLIQRALPTMSVSALIVAVALAVTGTPDLRDDRKAAGLLSKAEADIARGHPVSAMQKLGRAALYQNESVRITVTSSCNNWGLGFKDHALLEAQTALNLGYRPGEATHYRGRGCFLDTAEFRGLDFMRVGPLSSDVIYPRPAVDDEIGVRLAEIAVADRLSRPTETFNALGCLAGRYDLRQLASFFFVVGLNGNLRLRLGGSPHPEIIACIRSLEDDFRFFHDVNDDVDVFIPKDLFLRLPSPRRPNPPASACWVRFPTAGPCGGS